MSKDTQAVAGNLNVQGYLENGGKFKFPRMSGETAANLSVLLKRILIS